MRLSTVKTSDEFCNVSFLKMKYDFDETKMVFYIVVDDDDLRTPFVLYEVCKDEAARLVESGIGIWVLDGIACVDENQAVRGAPVQAKYVRQAFGYIRDAYFSLVEDGTIGRLREESGGAYTWGRIGQVGKVTR